MFCNDWIPFCSRNLFLRSVYRGQTKRKWSSFSTWFWQNTHFLFVGQSLYLYILLFTGSTPSRSCVSATLRQYIATTDKYFSAPNITLKDRYMHICFCLWCQQSTSVWTCLTTFAWRLTKMIWRLQRLAVTIQSKSQFYTGVLVPPMPNTVSRFHQD